MSEPQYDAEDMDCYYEMQERRAAMKDTPIKSGGFETVVTFETTNGDREGVVSVRAEIVDSDPSEAARKAVLRAVPQVSRLKWESIVVVLTRIGSHGA